MKKVRNHQGSNLVNLYPAQRTCPVCREPLVERYRQARYIVTLSGMLKLIKHVLECQTPQCQPRGLSWRPEGEGALALPHYTFGLDVVARVGGSGSSDEHQGTGRVGDTEHWSRPWDSVSGAVLDNGADGPGDHLDDHPAAEMVLP